MKRIALFCSIAFGLLVTSAPVPKAAQTTNSTLSTSFEASEGYSTGDLDNQKGWSHDLSLGNWQVEAGVSNFGDQAIQSPSGYNDTEARATTKSFPAEPVGDMILYMRRDDNNLHSNNFYVGFTTDHGENPEVVICMCEEGIIMQNTITGVYATLANPFTLGHWYKVHVRWDPSNVQASLDDGDFSPLMPNPANIGFARIYIMARGQATAYLDDIQDLNDPSNQITNLVVLVESFNLKQGIENSLDAKLSYAQSALDAANTGDNTTICNVLQAFINEVNAQSGHALTANQANQLITQAQQIRLALNCP